MIKLLKKLGGIFDARDLTIIFGLGAVFYGLFHFNQYIAFIVIGTAIACIGIFGVRN